MSATFLKHIVMMKHTRRSKKMVIGKRAITKVQAVVVATVIAVAAIAGGVAWWYTSKPTGELPPIKIGCCHPLTGYSQLLGHYFRMGVILATEEINSRGGILGRRVELYWADDKCLPADGVPAINKLISIDRVDAILGPQCSSVVLAVMPIINDAKVPMLICAATSPLITQRSGVGGNIWTFRINPHDGLMGPALAKFLVEDFHVRSMSMVVLNNDWGRGNVMVWQNLSRQLGIEIKSVDYFDYGETNFLPILTNIKNLNPDCLFLAADYEEGYHIMKAYRELGMTQLVVGRGGVGTKTMADKFGKELVEGVIGINFYSVKINNTEHIEFVRRFLNRWNELPDIVSAWGYVEAYVLFDAIKRAGTTEKEAVRNALKATNMDTFLGHIEFDDHNQAYCPVYVYRIHNGDEELIATVPTTPP
jgi:branched-chain amino acid transport system substrate-binding protein